MYVKLLDLDTEHWEWVDEPATGDDVVWCTPVSDLATLLDHLEEQEGITPEETLFD